MTSRESTELYLPLAKKALEFFDKSTDPFHAVQTSVSLLKEAGFEELEEDTPYKGKLQRGGRYLFTKNRSTLVAFTVGSKYQPGNGFKIVGGHTDSPNLRVKPRSKRSAAGCIQLGVECYGGGLWHTWFDRDLGLSGRVLVRNENKVEQRLVQIDRPLLRISNLAIHLQTSSEREAFAYNKEEHLSPVLTMEVAKALQGVESGPEEKNGWTEYQEPVLLDILSDTLKCKVEDIVDFELSLFDVQKASLSGAYSEFLNSGRLDNLASCFMAIEAFIDYVKGGGLESDGDVSMVVLYDHEEVGSTSAVGAASPIMSDAIRRVTAALSSDEYGNLTDLHDSCIRKSYVVSSDQAHAVHPNYISKHEKSHQPKMNDGIVIKRNSNQRYATNTITGILFKEVARKAGLPAVQEFIVRQDCGCGSTIGPAISSGTGIRTIDVGCPQLSMHSIRETMGICDLTHGKNMFKAFFQYFREVDNSVSQ